MSQLTKGKGLWEGTEKGLLAVSAARVIPKFLSHAGKMGEREGGKVKGKVIALFEGRTWGRGVTWPGRENGGGGKNDRSKGSK